ncbi:hypothetical protein M406DRAFT_330834 [Cryphonectria parasitica EP155]|uniref:SH3 domain-containing protein n=1 Tax=Cryphonectria parasitica (strain ATCC 38755 / EP155) TaxID=660469 RepID=A0A9P4Y0Y3_CRYP1|nr:uncharacterized protein M406DRAFT_330834 [Cryphonectria parasitica EP155]KAF3764498.1 hypothetical protein M406DRAFT_330834 [Cryphonectria parasitica EP155]
MPATSSPATSPPAISSPTSNPNHPPLPPLITNSPQQKRTAAPRPVSMSQASKNRLSQYSVTSMPFHSRPTSHALPMFPSSLAYTLVRDFAYPQAHPMHYGPPPEPSQPPSGMTTPASESRRLSDPAGWDGPMSWDSSAWASLSKVDNLAPIYLGDGPPWSEDEDLHSPVVSSRHRKHKSSGAAFASSRRRSSRDQGDSHVMRSENYDQERGYYVGTSGDGSERYYVNQGEEANGPGGEYVTYPPNQARHSYGGVAELQPRQYVEPNGGRYRAEPDDLSDDESPGYDEEDQSRYSKDYQFTITSPDEEMHGKAVALFDFARENENELPLVEGQIIWVSYRHGQGWLVAEDPKTQESGLVPEEYVRLLRDIEGGMTSLTGQAEPTSGSPGDAGTPTQSEHTDSGHTPTASTSSTATNGYHQPVVSTFSTSSKDLDPYPQHLLGHQAGQAPPQVVHYHGQRGGSQANTPTLSTHQETGVLLRRGSQAGDEIPPKKYEFGRTLSDAKMMQSSSPGGNKIDTSP